MKTNWLDSFLCLVLLISRIYSLNAVVFVVTVNIFGVNSRPESL